MARRLVQRWLSLWFWVFCSVMGVHGHNRVDEQLGLDPAEPIQSIRIQITVGVNNAAGSEEASEPVALNEPLALDLGLGFPLWLTRTDSAVGGWTPFGVMPQSGTTGAIEPGAVGVFEFAAYRTTEDSAVEGDPSSEPRDELWTSQLLEGVQVGDIRRIGLASPGLSRWRLDGLRVEVNGQLLFEKTAINESARDARIRAEQRLSEIEGELAVRQTEISELKSLEEAGFSTEADLARLKQLESEVQPVVVEQSRLNRQLQGTSPWYVENEFRPGWLAEPDVASARVTVISAPHTGADSRNFVYLLIGGHRYLLGTPANPLTPNFGPQTFQLDLNEAPLAAGDFRGFGLGMIASDLPQGDVPDRWHPQRLIVEIDQRVVYDSDSNPLDTASLAAIRIVPPVFRNGAGEAVSSAPGVREFTLWQAGTGQGLDLIHGGTEVLPDPGSPDAPAAEPGLSTDPPSADIIADGGWYDPGAPPFPGEAGFGPGWVPGTPWPPGWAPGWGPAWPPGWVPGGGIPGGVMPGLTWQDLILLGILDQLGLLPEGIIPPLVGTPPQIEKVTINNLTNRFEWEVTGDVTQIDHFSAELLLMRPDLAVPFATPISSEVVLPSTARSIGLVDFPPSPVPGSFDEQSRSFVVVRVTMTPTDPALGTHVAFTSLFPLKTTDPALGFVVSPTFRWEPLMGLPVNRPVSFGGEPGVDPETVWVTGETDTQSGLVFAGFSPVQHHIALRPAGDGDRLTAEVRGTLEGKYRLIAMLGSLGLPETATSVDVTTNCLIYELANPANQTSFMSSTPLVIDPLLAPPAMIPITFDIDTATDVGPGQMGIVVTFEVTCTHVDPLHPPVLTGIRLLSVP